MSMSAEGHPEGYWAQHPNSASQDKSGQDVDGGEAQGHARPTAKYPYNLHISSSGLYELRIGAGESGEPHPVDV
jgi:hypothetical protein